MSRAISGRIQPTEIPKDQLERLAYILGQSSAAAAAFRNMKAREQRGEDPVCYRIGTDLFVGPREIPPCV